MSLCHNILRIVCNRPEKKRESFMTGTRSFI